MAETFEVPVRGIGKPDYTREVSSARERRGITLKYGQQFALFSYTPTDLVAHPYAISWVKPVLAAGATAHIVDMATGVDTPYTIPAGYTGALLQIVFNVNQDCEVWVWMDGLLISCIANVSGGLPGYFEELVGYGTEIFDPTALSPHTMDFTIINRGGLAMRGEISISGIIEAVGTPPFPTEKTTECPFCHSKNVVPIGQTIIVCNTCEKTYYVRASSSIMATP